MFSIIKRIDKTNRNDNIYFEINDELNNFNNSNIQCKQPIRQVSGSSTIRETNTDRKQQQHTTRNDGQVSKKPRFLSG